MKNEENNSDSPLHDRITQWIDGDSSIFGTESELSPDQARELVLHSLLQRLHEVDDGRERRVEATIASLNKERLAAQSESKLIGKEEASHSSAKSNLPTKPRWAAWMRSATGLATIAASLVIFAVFMYPLIVPESAYAYMDRVITSAKAPFTRIYNIRIHADLLGREREITGTLHTHGIDQFVAEFGGGERTKTMLGADGNSRWWIRGNQRWNSEDGPNAPRHALIDRLTGLQLQMNQFLTSLPSQYELRCLDAEPLPGKSSVSCRPIEARRTVANPRLPSIVRVWADPETGLVTQMHLIREQVQSVASSRVELNLVEETDVPENYFSEDFHQATNPQE